ncbi:MAG: M1 family metallopeptidase [Hyphomonadaceae bacterium]|nr:M1 family metallopeptidase [Hyphomonadaceae bacterium]
MRVGIFALLSVLLAACNGANAPIQSIDDGLEDLIAQAPPGPLDPSPYPLHYDLDLTLDPRETRFGGTVTITLDVKARSSGLYLHGRDLVVTEVRSRVGEGQPLTGVWQPVLESGVAWLDYGQTVDPGEVVVEIDYNAPFDVNLSGLFKVTEQGDAYALAKSESIQARRFMPGFDQPAFKAPFDIRLTIPETDSAISNAPETAVETLEGGLKRVTFETTRPLPTYLLSLAVGSFDVVEAEALPPNEVRAEPIPLRGFARRGKGGELDLALETAPELVRIFEEALQQPYPYKKLDIVAAPQWPSGATELAAAITYRESRILASPDIGPAARRSLLAIHAHEVAHMWFGNLVTPPWWDDLWLKEAFASWGEGASLSVMYPGEGYELDAIVDGIRAMGLDSLSSARAVREPIALNENVRNAYDSITYNKGLAVIGMVDAYFGADIFRPALGRYVEAYEDGVADSPEFFDIIGRETNEPDLTRAFRSFVEQKGLPLLTIEQVAPYDYIVKQSRYAPLGSKIDPNRAWIIPFCWAHGLGEARERGCSLLTEDLQMVTLEPFDGEVMTPGWFIPNAGGTGYYRFSLPYESWQDLGRGFGELSDAEQLVTLDSVGAEFAAGRIDVDTVWRFIDEAVRDEERRVVQAAIREAGRFERFVTQDEQALAGYRAAVLDVFRDRYETLNGGKSNDPEQAILKSSLERFLIGTGEDTALRENLAKAAASFIGMEGAVSERTLNTDEYLAAMAVGMQVYGAPFLDQLLAARTQIDDPVFEQAVAYAIGQNRDPALSERVLQLALSGELGSRESRTIAQGQMNQDETRAQTWAWLKANFPTYLEVIPRQRKRSSPALAASLCSDTERDELIALFETHGALAEGHERSLRQTVERIELCAALDAANGEEVRTFFASGG